MPGGSTRTNSLWSLRSKPRTLGEVWPPPNSRASGAAPRKSAGWVDLSLEAPTGPQSYTPGALRPPRPRPAAQERQRAGLIHQREWLGKGPK
jgi:hypothetical protein